MAVMQMRLRSIRESQPYCRSAKKETSLEPKKPGGLLQKERNLRL